MKKSFIFATMAAAALFAGCSSNDDLTSNPGGDVINPNTEQVAIKIGVAQAVSTGMRGTGTVGGVADIANGTDGYTAGADNIWAGQQIKVYMFEKVTDANQKLTLAKDGQNVSLYENTAMYTPGSADNKIPDMGAEAFTNFGEAMITTGKIQYWPLNGNYDFFGYHGDDAVAVTAVNPVQDGDIVTAYKADFTIDGSQDLMSTKAAPTTADTELPGYEASKIYSASMARKNIQPNLTFNHLLTRLTFNIKAGNDEAAGVKITGYKDGNVDKTIADYNAAVAASQDVSGWTAVKAQTDPTTAAYTGVKVSKIEILSKKTGKMLVAWIADPTDKIEWDAETTNAAYMTLKARSTAAGDIYGYIKKDRSGSIITAAAWAALAGAEKASYEPFYNPNKALVDLTPIAPGYNPDGATDEEKFIKTKVGESLIVSLPITATVDSTDPNNEAFSDVADNNGDNEAYYIARVTLTQKVRDNWINDNLVEKSNSMVVKIPLPAGKTKFEINNSYNVNLTLYGFERIIVNTTLEAWKYGGEIDVIGE